MRIIETKVYKFEELSEDAKERARDWYREATSEESFYAEYVEEDFKTLCALVGICVDSVSWSGFYHQGSFAAFDGHYSYKKGALKAVREYAPLDVELQRIAKQLQTVQSRQFYKLAARIYTRRDSMLCDAEHTEERYRDLQGAEDKLLECFTDLADWFYKRLRSEYEWTQEDAQVDESIIANEYEFTEEGKRA